MRIAWPAWLKPAIASLGWVGAFIVVLLLTLLGHHYLDPKEGTAAWLQAAGSLFIIAATAWIAGRDFRQAQAREELARRSLWESIAVLARNCLEVIDGVVERSPSAPTSDFRGEFLRAYVPREFALPIDGLAAVPLHQIGNTVLVTAVLELRTVMVRIQKQLDDVNQDAIAHFQRENLEYQQRTSAFNRVASILRVVHGKSVEQELSRLASFVANGRRGL